mgnify:CR=1 FL=1
MIAFDLQGLQSVGNAERGIARYITEVVKAIVAGDAKCRSIAAASIVAKVTRDRIMADHARTWPGYGWERNRGYPTPEHIRALDALGLTPLHRRSFGPVRERENSIESLSSHTTRD